MKTSINNIFAIAIGTAFGVALAFVLTNTVPFYIAEYLPVFVGACISGLVINTKKWWIGVIVAILMIIVSILAFFVVTSPINKTDMSINYKILIEYLIYIPIGFMGGQLGCYFRKYFKSASVQEM